MLMGQSVSLTSHAASRQEVGDPSAGGVRHVQLGEPVLQQICNGGVKSAAEIYKKDPGVGSCRVQVLGDKIEGHLY